MRRAVIFLAVGLSSVPPPGHAASQEVVSPLRIGKIDIVANEIFQEDGPGVLAWAYRLGNRLHIRTREDVIRRELLFETGDPFDLEAIQQTERNLRALDFLRDASIETRETVDGEVDIRVITHDAWSLLPQIRIAKTANRTMWTLGVAEKNLLGWGKWVDVARRSGLDRDEATFFYFDPRLAGSRTRALVSYSEQSDGRSAQLILARPFFALSTEWAFGLTLDAFDQLDPLYEDGERVADLRHVRRHARIEVARALARKGPYATRLHLAYGRQQDEVVGDLRDFGILQMGVSAVEHHFVEMTHVNRFETTDDFNLGFEVAAFLGLSTPELGGEEGTVWLFSLHGQRGFQVSEEHFFIGSATWDGRHRRGSLEAGLATARLDYLNKQAPRWVLLGTAELQYGHRLDPETQLRLGAESGLRGYPVRQFVGDRSFRLSVEQRFFFADDVAQLVSFAMAAFFDTGFAWPEGQKIALSDLRSDVGVSLLLGRSRLAARTAGIRIDLAYALDSIAGASRWQVSVGSRIAL